MRRLTALAMAITISGSAWSATPPDTLVVARSIDDIASLDPAESFEITATNTLANIYQRLLEPDRQNPASLVPALASRWKAVTTTRVWFSNCVTVPDLPRATVFARKTSFTR
ncbi:Dipeptide-binding ABC transporter, periplasmic substrate-binding component [Pseudomonas savastanoi pv. glycinea]|nr:Dipeptide-binding ABC transporter, periplasmic substrate-binding component [Pseudomonas savastanoi pv. glycinea]